MSRSGHEDGRGEEGPGMSFKERTKTASFRLASGVNELFSKASVAISAGLKTCDDFNLDDEKLLEVKGSRFGAQMSPQASCVAAYSRWALFEAQSEYPVRLGGTHSFDFGLTHFRDTDVALDGLRHRVGVLGVLCVHAKSLVSTSSASGHSSKPSKLLSLPLRIQWTRKIGGRVSMEVKTVPNATTFDETLYFLTPDDVCCVISVEVSPAQSSQKGLGTAFGEVGPLLPHSTVDLCSKIATVPFSRSVTIQPAAASEKAYKANMLSDRNGWSLTPIGLQTGAVGAYPGVKVLHTDRDVRVMLDSDNNDTGACEFEVYISDWLATADSSASKLKSESQRFRVQCSSSRERDIIVLALRFSQASSRINSLVVMEATAALELDARKYPDISHAEPFEKTSLSFFLFYQHLTELLVESRRNEEVLKMEKQQLREECQMIEGDLRDNLKLLAGLSSSTNNPDDRDNVQLISLRNELDEAHATLKDKCDELTRASKLISQLETDLEDAKTDLKTLRVTKSSAESPMERYASNFTQTDQEVQSRLTAFLKENKKEPELTFLQTMLTSLTRVNESLEATKAENARLASDITHLARNTTHLSNLTSRTKSNANMTMLSGIGDLSSFTDGQTSVSEIKNVEELQMHLVQARSKTQDLQAEKKVLKEGVQALQRELSELRLAKPMKDRTGSDLPTLEEWIRCQAELQQARKELKIAQDLASTFENKLKRLASARGDMK